MVTSQSTALLRLATLIVALTSLAEDVVLLGYGDMPRPTASHMTLIPLGDTGRGLPARNEDGNVEHARIVQVLLTAYGTDAIEALRALSILLMSDAAEMFEAVADGLSVEGTGGVQDQTAILHTSYEPRAALTVTCGYVQVTTSAPPLEATSITVGVNGTDDVIEISTAPAP